VAAIVAPAASGAAGTATLATASSTDYRAVVTAHRTSGGAAPSAAVTVVTYERAGSHWRRTSTKPVPGAYFWKTVTGSRVLCRFDLATVGGTSRPHVTVALLQTPSLGCGPTETVPLP